MIWPMFFTAFGLMLVLEGALPFLSPSMWRRVIRLVFTNGDGVIRFMGLMSMLLGLVLITLARDFF